MSDKNTRGVAVIGLGQMGGGIARNLDQAGLLGAVWDPDPTMQAPYRERDDVAVVPPADLPAGCRRIIFVVPGVTEIAECLTGADAILERMERGGIILDLTTSDPGASGEHAAVAAERGVDYLDCGMTGGAAGAEAGTMTLMIGGEAKAIEACANIFDAVTGRIFHVGPSGAGHTLKLVHNMVLHTMFLTNVEGVRMAAGMGIDPETVVEVFNAGNARSFVSEVRFPNHILSGTWDGRSKVANLAKDLAMATDLSSREGAPTPFGDLTTSILARALEAGMENTDFTKLYEAFEDISGVADAN
ncbi:MAG TPA: NAD(P)-dependent oxidoreductase [Rhodospirillales bacterium]|jgi:3-hydroxyisobutyrate dehydrogenase|nr:NAD(P)-dependent oxidoreductase [Rhodospirillales bacterium]